MPTATNRKLKMEQGDIVVNRDGDQYIVARITFDKYLLISLTSGNRWCDGDFTLESLTRLARKDGFKEHKRRNVWL